MFATVKLGKMQISRFFSAYPEIRSRCSGQFQLFYTSMIMPISVTDSAMAMRMTFAVLPAHAPMDSDTVFAAATGEGEPVGDRELTEIDHTATQVMARAIARAVGGFPD